MTLQRILVATDFSAASERAIVRAGMVARDAGAALECLHVVPDSWLAELRAWLAGSGVELPEGLASIEARLANFVASDLQRCGIGATTKVMLGSPADAIAARAADGADLVVIGAHGRNFVRELFLGSTAIAVLARVAAPVLVVRRPADHPYGSVVVGTDFSPASAAAARLVSGIAPRARLTLLHAYEDPYGAEVLLGGARPDVVEHYRAAAYARARGAMDAFARELGALDAKVGFELRHGPPALKLIEAAESGLTDLVALGVRRKPALEALFLGSVSAHVVAESPCDVLVVRET
ncbi:MAG: universal stress protein [Burkholderiales bacterium]|nr:universal stress protein [Burkholderiales bacterium]